MICGQVCLSQLWRFAHVPLSCVPAITSQPWAGWIDTPMNCSVLLSFLSMWSSTVGTRDRSRSHVISPFAERGPPPLRCGSLHCDETSAKSPLVRITPPSEPSKIWVALPGLMTMACWSGWMPFGAFTHPWSKYGAYAHHDGWLIVASYDRSVNVRRFAPPVAAPSGSPAVVE